MTNFLILHFEESHSGNESTKTDACSVCNGIYLDLRLYNEDFVIFYNCRSNRYQTFSSLRLLVSFKWRFRTILNDWCLNYKGRQYIPSLPKGGLEVAG